ncbi:MAG: antitoxin VapB family protein [Thermoplasmata archaeon]
MSSRNVAVRKDVYDALHREKRGKESFTQVMLRLLHQRGSLEEIFGSWNASAAPRDEAQLRQIRGGIRPRGSR